jgi:hypothetical protein
MIFDCSRLKEMAHSISLVRSCDVVSSGALRLSTPFSYPNGSGIDVFMEQEPVLFESYVLSDYGLTNLYLNDAQVKMDSTERRRQILNDICSQLGVKFRHGSFELTISGDQASDISDAVMRISQACLRVSDFASHQRLRSANAFRDDVEDFFDASGLRYIPDVKVSGPYGADIKIDFEVNSSSYVLVLAAMNEAAAHSSATEIFSKWHDLRVGGQGNAHKFVTVYNSASPAIRPADIQRLGDYSETVSYPEQGELLVQVLSANPSAPSSHA